MDAKTFLSLEDAEKFTEVVRDFPVLYDKSKSGYSERDLTRNAWEAVAEKVDFIVDGKFIYCLFFQSSYC